jgi:galactonate dehydratase
MKIIDVKTFIMGTAWRNIVYVKVYTDEGLTGVGEATVQNRE